MTRSLLVLLLLPMVSYADDAFEKEVRPLFIEKCLKCHGPKKQEASLRLDSREALLKGGDSGPAMVPNQSDRGTLLSALRHAGEIKMPPSGKLSDAEIRAVEKWIQAGAKWPAEKPREATSNLKETHWAFQPITSPSVPENDGRTAIDRFLQAKRLHQKLIPNRSTDRRTLIRRLTLDLTGLPPTPTEIREFLEDTSPQAYEKIVERLLASPAYGERWGRHWLDVARYADTAGDGSDYPVPEARLYRDWVVAAINRDQPYDQFLREQIAGDILAAQKPSEDYAAKVTATGFLAIGKRYGYSAKPDYQHLDFADAIDSVGRSVLGLSLGCARCHDHKYDPVSASDYYALYGIFQSSVWAFPGGEEQKRPAQFLPLVPPDEVKRLETERTDRVSKIDAELARLNRERVQFDPHWFAGGIDLGFEAQTIGKPIAGAWLSIGPNEVLAEGQSPFSHLYPAGKVGVRLKTGQATNGIRHVFSQPVRSEKGKQIRFSIDFRTLKETTETGAYRFYLGRGVIASLAVEASVTRNEIAVRSGGKWQVVRKLEPGEWYSLQLTLDPEKKQITGTVGKPNDLTAIDPFALNPNWDGVIDTFICDATGHVAGPAPARDLDQIALLETPLPKIGDPPAKSKPLPEDAKTRLAEIEQTIQSLTQARQKETSRVLYSVAYGVSEGTPSNAKIQKRGEPDKLGGEVPRRFLELLGGDLVSADSRGSGRLELAQWLTRPSNPLTARVFVNRVWQWHFGRGLVPTASDFGVRGEAPSHPELVDYLAQRFIASGWSLKELHRLILHTDAYRQSSDDHEANLRLDPENRWLWRFAPRALEAETIRDGMLAVSGRLDRTPPTPHPFPHVETWGFTIHQPFHAVYDTDRRSLYLMVQRNRRHPFLALFDGADPNLSTSERVPTITPTQSLYLMNSPFVHRQAAATAERLLNSAGSDAEKIRLLFETAHGHPPTDAEVQETIRFLNNYQQRRQDQGTPAPASRTEAWNALARVVLTSNRFLYLE